MDSTYSPPSSTLSSHTIHSRHQAHQRSTYPAQATFVSSLPQSYQLGQVAQSPIDPSSSVDKAQLYDPTTQPLEDTRPTVSTHPCVLAPTGFEGGVGFDAATLEEQRAWTLKTHHPSREESIETLVSNPVGSSAVSSTRSSAGPIGFMPSGGRPKLVPSTTSCIKSPYVFDSSSIGSESIGGLLRETERPTGTVDRFNGRVGDETIKQNENQYNDEFEEDPPLLEELGVNPDHIATRMKAALLFYRLDHDLLVDVDMCGPLFIALCLGCSLLLSGKIHFAYIYGLSVTGCLCMCALLNFMSQEEGIDLYRTTSILGYGLLPVDGLAFLSIFFSLRNLVGMILSGLCVTWCTATASRFFETALQMHHQRFLIAYPVALIYACFVLITVF